MGDYQGGFRPERSTTDQIYLADTSKTQKFDKQIHFLFVDFKKAYDSIHQEFY